LHGHGRVTVVGNRFTLAMAENAIMLPSNFKDLTTNELNEWVKLVGGRVVD